MDVGGEVGLITPYLIGDSAYSLSPSVMKAYEMPSNASELEFNRSLRAARSTVERAFGRLKERFRIFRGELEYRRPELNFAVVGAACVLHNVCEKHLLTVETRADDAAAVRDAIANFVTNDAQTAVSSDEAAGKEKRDRLASLF